MRNIFILGLALCVNLFAGSNSQIITASPPLSLDAGVMSMPAADGTHNGYLTSSKYTSFNNSILPTQSGQGGKVLGTNGTALSWVEGGSITTGDLTGTSPILVSNGTAAVLGTGTALTCAVASGSQAGCLSSANWNTFNGKQSALSFGNLTSGTSGVTIGSGTGSVVGSGTTITINTADSTHNGLLSSADWNTFNAGGLPTQTGNNGKILTTNGSAASWAPAFIQPVATFTDLPLSGTSGETFVTEDTGFIYAWSTDSSSWVAQVSGSSFTPTKSGHFVPASPSYFSVGTGVNTGWHTSFVLSFWANVTNFNQYNSVYDNYTVSANKGVQIGFDITDGHLYVDLNASNSTGIAVQTVTAAPTLGVWEYWAVVYDGSGSASGITIYKNGVSQSFSTGSNNLSIDFLSATNTYVGGDNNAASSFFAGNLAQIALWNGRTFDSGTINTIYSSGSLINLNSFPFVPTAWWQLNGDVLDTEGFANGTNNNVTFTSSLPPVNQTTNSANAFLSNLQSPIAINKTLAFAADATYSIGNSNQTGRPKYIFLPGNETGTEGSEGYSLVIGDPVFSTTHEYPIHIAINDLAGLQNWLINKNTGGYAIWFAGYDKINKYVSMSELATDYLNSGLTGPQGAIISAAGNTQGLTLGNDGNFAINFMVNEVYRWKMMPGGDFVPGVTNANNIGGASNFVNSVYTNSTALGYQRVASAASAGSTTISNQINTLILHAAGTLTTYTVITPASPLDGQVICINSNQAQSALTVTGNSGQTVVGSFPIAVALGAPGPCYQYVLTDTLWYPY